MTTVINIRSTSGGGKTTTVRGIMKKGKVTPIRVPTNKNPEAYRVDIKNVSSPVYVLGSYENQCGGMDTVQTQDEICNLIRKYAAKGHVLVEGLLMSHTFGRYASLDRELHAKGIHFIWAILDTPLELCLQRVTERREAKRLAKANPPPFKPLDPKNTTSGYVDTYKQFGKCNDQNPKDWKDVPYPPTKLDARWVDHKRSVEQVFSWLTEPRAKIRLRNR